MTVYNALLLPEKLKSLVKEVFGAEYNVLETTELINPVDPWAFMDYDIDDNLRISPSKINRLDQSNYDQDVVNGKFTDTIYIWNIEGTPNNTVMYFENNVLTLFAINYWTSYPIKDRAEDFPGLYDTIIHFTDDSHKIYKVAHDETDDLIIASFYEKLFPRSGAT